MADTDDPFDQVGRLCVEGIADDEPVVPFHRHLPVQAEQQTAAGLVGDGAGAGPFPRGGQGPHGAGDLGLPAVILAELDLHGKVLAAGAADPGRMLLTAQPLGRKDARPAAGRTFDGDGILPVDKVFLPFFAAHDLPPRVQRKLPGNDGLLCPSRVPRRAARPGRTMMADIIGAFFPYCRVLFCRCRQSMARSRGAGRCRFAGTPPGTPGGRP